MMDHPTFNDMYDEAARHPDYWAELTMLSFSEDMLGAMQAQSVARACSLSRRAVPLAVHVPLLEDDHGRYPVHPSAKQSRSRDGPRLRRPRANHRDAQGIIVSRDDLA
jgi:hypothetical protein